MTGRRLAVFFGRRAAAQIEEANAWWRVHRPAAPDALVEELGRAIDLISRQPGIGAVTEAPRLKGIRRILLPRVGYLLFYRVATQKRELHILAVWHARRGSSPEL